MMTPLKWFTVSFIMIFFVIAVAYASSVQNLTTHSTSEVESMAEAVSVGMIRSEINDGDDFGFIDRDELIASLVAHVSSVQKAHGYDVSLDYVFVDGGGSLTETDKEIRGVQFRIQLFDEQGELKGTAEKHIALNYPLN